MAKRYLIYFLILATTTGCTFWKKLGKKKPAVTQDSQNFLGTISMVNEDGRFVLVDFGGFAAPIAGSDLQVKRAGEEVATLRAGTEIRRPFAAADIVDGTPQQGDDVWSKKLTP